jgi:hypothetical protein
MGWAAAGCLRAGKRRPAAWKVCGLKEGGERELGPLERRERGERKVFLSFSFKFFSNSFFKLSNFKQTEIHAFKT